MKKISETIVFFGSGPVAAESLRLLAKDFTIEAVITKPRPAHHRGEVPVLTLAQTLSLPTYTATDRRSLDKLFMTRPVKSKIAVLVDFGIIVSQQVIDYFPFGIINSHFSLLPEWRGADPITFSVLSGQKKTGVSLIVLTAGMDEGPILAYTTHILTADTTTPSLTKDLIELSYQQLKTILPLYIEDKIIPLPQDTSVPPTYSRKLTKEDGNLDFTKPAQQLEREVRAFIEWPKSRTQFGSLEVIVTKAHVINANGKAGHTSVLDKLPVVYCAQQALALDRVKPAGKQEMTGPAFLAGYKQIFLAD